MASMNWPTGRVFEYQLRKNEELNLVIPLEKEKSRETNRSEVKGRY